MKKIVSIAVSTGASSVLVFFLLKDIDFGSLSELLKGANYLLLIPVFFFIYFHYVIKALRWKIILAPEEPIKKNSDEFIRALMTGFFVNNLVPLRAGDMIRPFVLKLRAGYSVSKGISSIFIEKVFDILLILFSLIISSFMFGFPDWINTALKTLIIITTVIVAGFLLIIVNDRWILRVIRHLESRWKSRIFQKAEAELEKFIAGISVIRKPYPMAVSMLLSGASYILLGTALYLIVLMFHASIPFHALFFVLGLTGLGMILPSAPGYIGNFHYFCTEAFVLLKVLDTREQAAGISIVFHLCIYIFVIAAGFYYIYGVGIRIADLLKIRDQK